jgi:hypothetical protein
MGAGGVGSTVRSLLKDPRCPCPIGFARRVNWVWYVNIEEANLPPLLTGNSGRRFDHFVPPGESSAETISRITALAHCQLPPQFAAVVEHSEVFLEPVFDMPPAVKAGDHTALIGDAAGTVRPHTASLLTPLALDDAAALAQAIDAADSAGELPARLKQWEVPRLSHLVGVARHGIRLASQSALGVAGPQFLSESRKAG